MTRRLDRDPQRIEESLDVVGRFQPRDQPVAPLLPVAVDEILPDLRLPG
jgi:hypothetical protein